MIKNIWHKIIVKYLEYCAGAFHCFPYGAGGRYVVLMMETEYFRYKNSTTVGPSALRRSPRIVKEAPPWA